MVKKTPTLHGSKLDSGAGRLSKLSGDVMARGPSKGFADQLSSMERIAGQFGSMGIYADIGKIIGPLSEAFDLFKTAKATRIPGSFLENTITRGKVEPRVLAEIGETLSTATRFIYSATSGLRPYFEELAQADRLDKAGWLPHPTIPDDLLASTSDADDLSKELERHYRNNWHLVRSALQSCLTEYAVDEESNACFLEALDNHADGRYRSVCRLLFPEIERVTRRRFHEGRFGNITNLRLLRGVAGELPASEFGYFQFFRRLEDHIYCEVRNSDALKQFQEDSVPNRHAAVHGFISYSAFANSMNTIFMAQYVYRIIYLSRSPEFCEVINSLMGTQPKISNCLITETDFDDDESYRKFLAVVHAENNEQFWARMRRENMRCPDRFTSPTFAGGPLSPRSQPSDRPAPS